VTRFLSEVPAIPTGEVLDGPAGRGPQFDARPGFPENLIQLALTIGEVAVPKLSLQEDIVGAQLAPYACEGEHFGRRLGGQGRGDGLGLLYIHILLRSEGPPCDSHSRIVRSGVHCRQRSWH